MKMRYLLSLFAMAAITLSTPLSGATAVESAFGTSEEASDGWRHSPWFGWFWSGDTPWIYHLDGDWFYYGGGEEETGIYLYEFQFAQWIWTSTLFYSWVYAYGPQAEWLLHPREAVVAPTGMVHVAGGTFFMGERQTTVSSFHLAVYPTTLAQWNETRGWGINNGYDISNFPKGCASDHPVHSVTWYEAVKWCNARSEAEGLTPVYYTDTAHTQVYRTGQLDLTPSHVRWDANGYRLPTEAEHWFAHTGGVHSQGYTYAGTNDPNEAGWYDGNSAGAPCDIQWTMGTWPVGQKLPNELGLYDMSGNVWERTFDWYVEELDTEAAVDPRGPESGTLRTGRGGSWLSPVEAMNTGLRGWSPPAAANQLDGFRVARTPGD